MAVQRESDSKVAERNRVCVTSGDYELREKGKTYSLAKAGNSIHCWLCGRTSYSMGDVNHLYCGACNAYHAQLGEHAALS